MWLLEVSTYELHKFPGPAIPPYAILSHTWGFDEDEVSFSDLRDRLSKAKKMKGFNKIEGSCIEAMKQGLRYVWIDTCCINKEDKAELSHSINSMFEWYKQSKVCFAYLADVLLSGYSGFADTEDDFSKSRWFTRGWTLQELLAPGRVEFYTKVWSFIQAKTKPDGDVSQIRFIQKLCNITGIRYDVLTDPLTVSQISYAERLSWVSRRFTTEEEDLAYCLMGLFDVKMPVRYGEGRAKAFQRMKNGSLHPDELLSRRSRQHLGIDESREYDPELYQGFDAQRRHLWKDPFIGKKKLTGFVNWMVNKGEYEFVHSVVSHSFQIRFKDPKQDLKFALYSYAYDDPPDTIEDSTHFDISLTDIDHRMLHGGVSEKLGCNYLSRAAKILKPIPEINGILFGPHHRPFFAFVTTYEQFSYNLHFLFDTGSPFTYLSYDACDVFFKDNPLPNNFSVKLNGLTVLVRPAPARSHFKDVNILGADFCALHNVQAIANYKLKEAKLVFLDHQ